MPDNNAIGSFFSGLLGGVGQGILQRKQAEHEKEIAEKSAGLKAIDMMLKDPRTRPEEMTALYKTYTDLLATDTKPGRAGGKGKGGDQRQQLFDTLGKVMQAGVTSTIPQDTAFLSGAKIKKPFFRSDEEMGAADEAAKHRDEEFRSTLRRQEDEQKAKEAAAKAAQVHLFKMNELGYKNVQKETEKVRERAAQIIKAIPGITQVEAETQASNELLQAATDKHAQVTSQIAATSARVKQGQEHIAQQWKALELRSQQLAISAQNAATTSYRAKLAKGLADGATAKADMATLEQSWKQLEDNVAKGKLSPEAAELQIKALEAMYETQRQGLEKILKEVGEPPETAAPPAAKHLSPKAADSALKRYADKYFGGDVEKAKVYAAEHP